MLENEKNESEERKMHETDMFVRVVSLGCLMAVKPELKKIGHEIIDHEVVRSSLTRGANFILAAYVPLVIVSTGYSYDNSVRRVVLEVAHLNPDFRASEIETIAKKHGFEYAGTIEEKLE